jgi:hypothetical protein
MIGSWTEVKSDGMKLPFGILPNEEVLQFAQAKKYIA